MTTKIIYISEDGRTFEDKIECMNHEENVNRFRSIMSKLRSVGDLNNSTAIQQDKKTLKQVFNEFVDLCDELFGTHDAESYKSGKRDLSHLGYLLDNGLNRDWPEFYPNGYFRFASTDFNTGIEYCQPYYVYNPGHFTGTVL